MSNIYGFVGINITNYNMLRLIIFMDYLNITDELLTIKSDYFPKNGGIITGNVKLESYESNESFVLKNLNDDSTVIPKAKQIRAFRIHDKNGMPLGDIRFGHETTGEINTSIVATCINEDGMYKDAILQLSPNSGGTADSVYLKFNGQHVITASNPYTITHNTTVLVKRNVDTSYLELVGGPSNKSGAILRLDGKGSTNAGQFRLQTGNGTTNKSLIGKPDGTLFWDGNLVVCVSSWISDTGTEWYRKYSDGWVEQGGLYSKTGTSCTITFPVRFSDTNYTLTTQEFETSSTDTEGVDFNILASNLTENGCRFSKSKNRQIKWYACGKYDSEAN